MSVFSSPAVRNDPDAVCSPAKKFFSAARSLSLGKAVLTASLLLSGCDSHRGSVPPNIEFTKVPPAAAGDSEKLNPIEGRVTGARPGQKMVLYARAGPWWIQPVVEQPFTEIQPDSTWKSPTHPGSEYAALLVDSDYRPALKTEDLPKVGGPVAAVATVPGMKTPDWDTKTVSFSGYDWNVRNSDSDRNGTSFHYNSANASIDSSGFLHLRIAKQNDRWTCSEVSLRQSFGYGTYRFTVEDVGRLEPAAVLSMVTWDDVRPDQNHREMDVEISRWGDPGNKNAQYVVQPFYIPVNVSRFSAPSGPLTYSFNWTPGKVSFGTFRGTSAGPGSNIVAAHDFTSGIPTPGAETAHINFCAYAPSKAPLQRETEIVVEKFQFLP
jgi:hypothetical protein